MELSKRQRDRLDRITSIEEGWYDVNRYGKIGENTINTVKTLLLCLETHLPEPSLFPSPDGDINLDWSGLIENPLSIYVYSNGRCGCYVYRNGDVLTQDFSHNQIDDIVSWVIHYYISTP